MHSTVSDEPRIETLSSKKLVGKRLQMTLNNNRTPELFRSFMPERKNIQNPVSTELFCMQLFNSSFSFNAFNPETPFEKWAAMEVADLEQIPEGMESFIVPGGLYAVFLYKGTPADAEPAFRYIFQTWLPASEYEVDVRPHFEILGEKYKNNDPSSEEDLWIPIRKK